MDDPRLIRAFSLRSQRCPTCGYDLTGATSATCPECGATLRLEAFVHPDRRAGSGWRHLATLAVAVMLLFTVIGVLVTSRLLLVGLIGWAVALCALALVAVQGWVLFLALFKARRLWDRPSRVWVYAGVCAGLFLTTAALFILNVSMGYLRTV